MLFKFKNNVTSSTRTRIYIYRIVNENVLEKQKIRGKEKNYDVIVPTAARTKKTQKGFIPENEKKKRKV